MSAGHAVDAEIATRNRLNPLTENIELDLLRNDASRYVEHEARSFEIIEAAIKRWLAVKRG